MKSFEWAEPTSIGEAQSLLSEGAVYKAGGVDLLDMMKEHLLEPLRLVNLRRIPGLDKIKFDAKNGLSLGPLVTLDEISKSPEIIKHYRALADSAGHAATPQIRNMATAAGNLLQRPRCWYFRNENFPCRKKGGEICYAQEGENQYHAIFNNKLCAIVHPSSLAVALAAFGASIKLQGPKGDREISLEKFFTLPNVDLHRENVLQTGEIITEIKVPAVNGSTKSAYIKQGEKESFDWPIAEAAAVIVQESGVVKSASIVLGAAAPVPHRATAVEEAIVGTKMDAGTIRKAAGLSVHGATPLERNQYKLTLIPAVVEELLTQLTKEQA